MHRQLIINADDFGLTPGVAEGILHGAKSGYITSTSVMVNQLMHQQLSIDPSALQSLGFGVHLNITTGKPILPPEDLSTLVDTAGIFHNIEYVLGHLDDINPLQVEKEWRAQVIGFLIKFGRPDHLDSHHHLHLLPPFFPIFLQIAEEMHVPVRFPISPVGVGRFQGSSEGFRLSPYITDAILEEDYKLLAQTGTRFPDYFCKDFITPTIGRPEMLHKFLENLPQGITEMICHPGYLDDTLFQLSSYTQVRVEELKALTDPSLEEILTSAQVELIRYNRV